MATFVIQTKNNPIVKEFIEETNHRLLGKSFVTNPYQGRITEVFNSKDSLTYLISMSPIYPKPLSVPIFIVLIGTVFSLHWATFLGVFFLLFNFLWSAQFLFIMVKAGLKKKGYQGKLTKIKNNELLKEVVYKLVSS